MAGLKEDKLKNKMLSCDVRGPRIELCFHLVRDGVKNMKRIFKCEKYSYLIADIITIIVDFKRTCISEAI